MNKPLARSDERACNSYSPGVSMLPNPVFSAFAHVTVGSYPAHVNAAGTSFQLLTSKSVSNDKI
jgi:hypothetical protein